MSERFFRYFIVPLMLLAGACGEEPGKMFTKVSPSASNIEFKNILIEDEAFNVLNYPYFYNGGGVAVGDINNDGLPDILFTGNMVRNRLYLNKGNFEFEDITRQSTVADKQGWCTGATMADVNADGWLDIYICRSADGVPDRRKNLLFINNRDNTFSEQADQFGIADNGYSTHAAFFDYDKDNDLDLVVINHSQKEYMQGAQEKPGIRKQINPAYSTHFYRNDGGRFTDVTHEAGVVSNVLTFGLGLAVSDLNNDGWPDMYISNDFNEGDYCFINQKDGTFREMSAEMLAYSSLFSMGNEAADINNDGLQDIITLDMLPEGNYLQKMHNGSENFDKFQLLFNNGFFPQYSRNMLQLNRGDGTFDEIGQFAGISNTDWSWAPLAADFDNDGKKDVFITNGYVKDYTDMDYIKYNVDMIIERDPQKQQEMMRNRMNKLPTIKIPNYLFRNEGDLKFSNQTVNWGLNEPIITSGAAYADFDNDGALDVVMNNCNDVASLYKNTWQQKNANGKYLKVKLKGNGQNLFAIGSKVTLTTVKGTQVQELMPSRGFQSSVDYLLHFGIAADDSVTAVKVNWPNGLVSNLDAPGSNRIIECNIADAAPDSPAILPAPKPLYKFLDTLEYKHTENDYNDFTQQNLLPQWFSRPGPALAKGDINGDGREDIFVGGAKGHASAIFIQNANGTFRNMNDKAISADSRFEDITAAFFDADGDGDNDLFVGSGGYEIIGQDSLLQNRLYLNNGRGVFTRAADALPADKINDHSVTIGDYNGDGHADIFNGGFCLPGKYPEGSGSQLLLNDGRGKFRDATQTLLPGFNRQVLVTSSAAGDFNGDGKPDLAIAGHWTPVEIWLSGPGQLTRDTAFIRNNAPGLFNALVAADVDGDGDDDLVVGNQGLNTQFATKKEEPMEMFYADFDDNGTAEPVISYYIEHKRWPIYSRDDLVQQIPSFNKRFLFYSDFAKAGMEDLFGEKLNQAAHYTAYQMASLVLENTGSGFEVHELPKEAQWYPVYSIVVQDMNGDGKKDLVLGGNHTYTRIKFGAYGTGKGDVFISKDKFKYQKLSSSESGIRVSGDVRNIVSAGRHLVFGINNQKPVCFTVSN